jgi:hypothetical protein
MMSMNSMRFEEASLSQAWAKAFLACLEPGCDEIVPLVVTVTGFSGGLVLEDAPIRNLLDRALKASDMQACGTVASTIFPRSLWNIERDRSSLYDRYRHILPRIKKGDSRNRYGTYFERLIDYAPNAADLRKKAKSPHDRGGQGFFNQLEHIIGTFRDGNHRRSALQASTFYPALDLTHQRQRGFPCLQHVAFSHLPRGRLAITGFYAYQYLFERAYGNFLGLCDLGNFVAHELGLSLARMSCVAAVAKRDIRVRDAQHLKGELKQMISYTKSSVSLQ